MSGFEEILAGYDGLQAGQEAVLAEGFDLLYTRVILVRASRPFLPNGPGSGLGSRYGSDMLVT